MTPRMDAAAKPLEPAIEVDVVNKPEGIIISLPEEAFTSGTPKGERTQEDVDEFYRRATSEGKLDAGRTVRSGLAYDFDSTDPVPAGDAERAAELKTIVGFGELHGIEGRPVYRFLKRAFDITFSAAFIVAFWWLFAIIAVAVKLDDPKGPVFFKQTRVGWSIIGQKSGAARGMVSRPALSALSAHVTNLPRVIAGVAS